MNDSYKLQVQGIHKDKPLDKVPLKYLDWLIGQEWMGFKYPKDKIKIRKYLETPCIAKELESELRQDEEEIEE